MAKNGNGTGKRRGRKSKAEGSTGAKEAAVEVRTAGELGLKPVEIDKSNYDFHLRGVMAAKEMMEKYQGAYRSAMSAAKKANPDIHEAIVQTLRLKKMDVADIKHELEISGFVLKSLGSTLQLTIHDQLLGNVEDAAYRKGKDDAVNGRSANSPYPEGSDLHEKYMTGWTNGIHAVAPVDRTGQPSLELTQEASGEA